MTIFPSDLPHQCFECGEPCDPREPFCSPQCEELNAIGGFIIYMDRLPQREVRRPDER